MLHCCPCVNFQYNFKKQNETAVREEAVEIANLLDGVSHFIVLSRDVSQLLEFYVIWLHFICCFPSSITRC